MGIEASGDTGSVLRTVPLYCSWNSSSGDISPSRPYLVLLR